MKINRFGILLDSYLLKKWQYDSVLKVLESTNFELSLVVLNSSPKKISFSWKHFVFLLFKRLFVNIQETKLIDIRQIGAKFDVLKVSVNKIGQFSEYFKKDDVDLIKSYNLDFLLRFGFGIIRGEVLNSTIYGVWSFHHGDEQKYRGGPYCFWEIYYSEPCTSAILQRLTNKLDGGIVLKKGYFKTLNYSFSANISQALSITIEWPAQLCRQIELNTFELSKSDAKTNAKIYKAPSNIKMITFVLLLLKNKVKYLYRTYLTFDHWHVGYINKNIKGVLSDGIKSKEINWLKNTSNHYFIADPFVFNHNNNVKITVEYLPYNSCRGKIMAFSGTNFSEEDKFFALSEKFHLSFPNIFENNGNTYCLPEAYESNCLNLYEKQNERWVKHEILRNIFSIDPEIIFHDGYFYLFTTIKYNNHDTKLFLYFSKDLFKDWKPHIMNPVVYDIRSARAAGKIFNIGGILYRPGQNYSIDKEGSISISKIKKLSPYEYEEEIVSEILPIKNSAYSDKIHTINCYKDITVIDACKIKSLLFRPDILVNIIRSKLK